MTTARETTTAAAPFPIAAPRLGLWVFLSTVTMLFAAFCSAYLVRRATGDWSRIDLPDLLWINTLVLVASSVVLGFAGAVSKAARRRLLALTAVLGALFVAGQLAAWRELMDLGVYVPTTAHGSFFFIFTGLHGLHLVGGILFLVSVAVSELRRRRTEADRRRLLALASTYWHYMGGLWIFLLIFLTAV